MVGLVLELMFDVHQVAVERIKPAGEDLRHVQGGGRILAEKSRGICDVTKSAGRQRSYGGGGIAPRRRM